jgi:radical SAM protein with 4Fe4S-binding SPASM domain
MEIKEEIINGNYLFDSENRFETRKMSLVIKPTEACNFACDFCSSSYLVDDKKARLDLEKIYQFLKRFPLTEVIFVVGGDPLLMPPSYYESLLNHIELNKYPTKLAITTNLWDWYKNPKKWENFLKHPLVEVGTSFQYGDGRKINKNKVFTEEIFKEVYYKFKKEIPEKELSFLAVIDDSNEHLALKHVYLAKELKTQCRLVWSNQSGRQNSVYPMAKLYKIMLEIWRLGLAEYEQTAISISDKLNGFEVSCPVSRNCDSWMRSLNADGRYFSCGPMNDDLDKTNEIDFNSEVVKGDKYYLPIQSVDSYQFLKEECLSCKMFQVCNACRKHVKDLKKSNKVEEQCTAMKSIMHELEGMSSSEEMENLKEKIGYYFK